MEDHDLKNLFGPAPTPDENRKKEALNLAVATFEAQKSADSKNNAKNAQGMSLLSRLISQITKTRSEDMTKNKKFVYGGLIGGLATACVALLVYGGGIPLIGTSAEKSAESLTVASAEDPLDRWRRMQEENKIQQGVSGLAKPSEQSTADTNQVAVNDLTDIKDRWNRMQEAKIAQKEELLARIEPPKGNLPVPMSSSDAAPAKAEGQASIAPAPVSPPMMMAESSVAAGAMPMARAKMVPGAVIAQGPMVAFAPMADAEVGRDKFTEFEQNSIKQVKAEPMSTFSIDVDTASYSFVRQSLDQGVLPQPDAVRIEEMVNYFDYAYPGPETKDEPFKTNIAVKPSPWNEGKKLITIGIKGFDIGKTEQPNSNLVFLIDTSGSMNEPNKLPLLKQSLTMLLDSLKPTDKVSIVVYAGSAGTILQPTAVSDKNTIINALNNLSAGGSTAGGEGIRLAYQTAQSNFDEKAVNRVILATDGDFNVGITDPKELQGFVERERGKGIFLSVLGFGRGNYNDDMMQKLAQNGNGVAAYIDTLNEARKVLVQEAGAALFPIAKDVKIQVEFNPSTVSEYRLVGYETRALHTEDFNNDKVDAGDIGAGAEVTAMYEVTPADGKKLIDDSRYAPQAATDKSTDKGDELAFVKIRYKLPKEDMSKLITTPVTSALEKVDPVIERETNWAEAVAGFAQLLKGGKFTGTLTYDDVLKLAQANKGDDPFGYRAEFINLVYKAKTAAALPMQNDGSNGNGEQLHCCAVPMMSR